MADYNDIPLTGDPATDAAIRAQWAEAAKQRRDSALLRYGDEVLVPSLPELGSEAWKHVKGAGEAMLAFGPMGEALDAPIMGIGALMRSIQAKPVAMSADEIAAANAASRDSKAAADAQAKTQAFNAENASSGTVPLTSVLNAERAAVTRGVENTPYVQPIRGRQGLPSKEEQARLANQYFEAGGRQKDLGPPGPWGRDPGKDAQAAIQAAADKAKNVGTTGPRANKPGVQDLMTAYQASQARLRNIESIANQAVSRGGAQAKQMEEFRWRWLEAQAETIRLEDELRRLTGPGAVRKGQ